MIVKLFIDVVLQFFKLLEHISWVVIKVELPQSADCHFSRIFVLTGSVDTVILFTEVRKLQDCRDHFNLACKVTNSFGVIVLFTFCGDKLSNQRLHNFLLLFFKLGKRALELILEFFKFSLVFKLLFPIFFVKLLVFVY